MNKDCVPCDKVIQKLIEQHALKNGKPSEWKTVCYLKLDCLRRNRIERNVWLLSLARKRVLVSAIVLEYAILYQSANGPCV